MSIDKCKRYHAWIQLQMQAKQFSEGGNNNGVGMENH